MDLVALIRCTAFCRECRFQFHYYGGFLRLSQIRRYFLLKGSTPLNVWTVISDVMAGYFKVEIYRPHTSYVYGILYVCCMDSYHE